jgi:ATP adenylyltransferase
MDRLWAPWRMPYILSTVKEPDEGCVFCKMLAANDDEKNLIVHRGSLAFVVMNLYPYNSGHLMVVPYTHTGDYSSLTNEEHLDLTNLMGRAQRALTKAMQPHGFNIGMNLGRASGAGIADHLHYHVVPRWSGDSNFMFTTADTKVMSENLPDTWKRIRDVF